MVFYFTSNVTNPPTTLYMGRDKFENEDLIKYGVEEDLWFHVDNLSSAHVYLRLEEGQDWQNLSEELLEDIAQLTKANSIEGNKRDNIIVIYTPWSNLKKSGGLEVGQVTFHNAKLVKKVQIKKRKNEIINRLNKTKVEKNPDFIKERVEYERSKREKLKNLEKQKKLQDNAPKSQEYGNASKNDYDYSFLDEREMISNYHQVESDNEKYYVQDMEEDFM